MEFLKEKKNFVEIACFFLFVISVFFVFKTINEVKDLTNRDFNEQSTIAVSGEGEIFAVPDIANVSFTSSFKEETLKEAQDKVSVQIEEALEKLEEFEIEERDIKTLSYTSYPQYTYPEVVCISYPCPPRGERTLDGYEVSQTISVKIRDTAMASNVLEMLGTLDVSNISGPSFSVDDEETLNALARKKAIDDAKEKAKVLAKDLGVKIVRIVSFSENGGYYQTSFRAEEMAYSSDAGASPAPKVNIPQGENSITSTVTIIFEVK